MFEKKEKLNSATVQKITVQNIIGTRSDLAKPGIKAKNLAVEAETTTAVE